MRRIVLVVLTFFAVLMVNGQGVGKELLLDYVTNLEQFGVPENGKACYLDMAIRNVYNGEASGPADVQIQLYLTKSQVCYTSAYFSFFQDSTEAFVILPMNKQILWYKKSQMQRTEEQALETTDFQKEIIKSGTISAISEAVIDKHDYKVIGLIPSSEVATQFRVQKLLFYYSKERHEINRFKVLFSPSERYKSQEYIYDSFKLNYKKADPELPVRSRVFDKSGKLKEVYKGYQLIDKRA